MFITTKVFDPALEGQAVKLSGMLDGNYVISKVRNYSIEVVGAKGTFVEVQKEEFEKELIKLAYLQPEREKEPHKTGFNRNQGSREKRSFKQIQEENEEVERILQENIEPMKLADILRHMRRLGYINWCNNNASGFVHFAIKSGMNIKKKEYGVYSYDWGGQK